MECRGQIAREVTTLTRGLEAMNSMGTSFVSRYPVYCRQSSRRTVYYLYGQQNPNFITNLTCQKQCVHLENRYSNVQALSVYNHRSLLSLFKIIKRKLKYILIELY